MLSRFHAIFITKNWSLSDLDPKLIIPDPDPANNFRIHNTVWDPVRRVKSARFWAPTGTYLPEGKEDEEESEGGGEEEEENGEDHSAQEQLFRSGVRTVNSAIK